MILIRECSDSGKVINPAERDQLRKDCLRHATSPNGVIDWEVYNLGFYGEDLFSELSSDGNDDLGSGSDCVFLYASSGTAPKEEVCREICPFHALSSELKNEVLTSSISRLRGMACFAKEVRVEFSLYTDVSDINFFRTKLDISSTGNEEDVVLSCDVDERVCKDGNRPSRPTWAYGLTYDRPGQAMLFS